jgi:hypothetical protein
MGGGGVNLLSNEIDCSLRTSFEVIRTQIYTPLPLRLFGIVFSKLNTEKPTLLATALGKMPASFMFIDGPAMEPNPLLPRTLIGLLYPPRVRDGDDCAVTDGMKY